VEFSRALEVDIFGNRFGVCFDSFGDHTSVHAVGATGM
jgi:hypothetical protein